MLNNAILTQTDEEENKDGSEGEMQRKRFIVSVS